MFGNGGGRGALIPAFLLPLAVISPRVSGDEELLDGPGPAEPCMAMARRQKDDKQRTDSYAAMFRTTCVSVKFRAVIGCSSPS